MNDKWMLWLGYQPYYNLFVPAPSNRLVSVTSTDPNGLCFRGSNRDRLDMHIDPSIEANRSAYQDPDIEQRKVAAVRHHSTVEPYRR